MKTPRPWYRKQNDTWYTCLHGRQVPLCKGKDNKAEAQRRYFQLMAAEDGRLPEAADTTVAQVADLFLDWSYRHNKPRTYAWYKDFLQDFCDRHGGLRALQLKPLHVSGWLDRHGGWNDGARRCAVTAVKRCFNWAVDEGVLPFSPVKKVRKPPAGRRDRVLTDAERREILSAIKDQPFRDFVFAMQQTGCRPSEVARVSSEHVNLELGLWVFGEHKTRKKTGRPRVVYLTPAMVELTGKLLAKYPTGPLFRGPRGGRPFSRNGIRCRFRRLREKLPHLKGVISYTYRHSYVTDALENGVGVAQVAELVGHCSTGMVMRHYQHLREKREHMKQAAEQAVRKKA